MKQNTTIPNLLAKLPRHLWFSVEKNWLKLKEDDAPSKVSLRLPIGETFSREATATRGAWNAALTGGFNHRYLNNHFTL